MGDPKSGDFMHLCKLHTLQIPKATNCLSDIKPDKLVLNTVFFFVFYPKFLYAKSDA